MKKVLLALVLILLLTGCEDKKPAKVSPVENFKVDQYLGTWYEIARLENRFEKGMEAISATYSMREDAGIKVLNKGYKSTEKDWNTAEGKAYFIGDIDKGFLKVSFFGPFYGSYIVMDTDYTSYSMISGPDLSYFWILSRRPKLEQKTLTRLIAKAKDADFNTSALIYVDQRKNYAK